MVQEIRAVLMAQVPLLDQMVGVLLSCASIGIEPLPADEHLPFRLDASQGRFVVGLELAHPTLFPEAHLERLHTAGEFAAEIVDT